MHGVDLKSCDSEPIHIPGAIQPHGILLIADGVSLEVVAGAGNIEDRLSADWLGRPLDQLLGQDVRAQIAAAGALDTIVLERPVRGVDGPLDAVVHRGGQRLLIELEPAPAEPAGAVQILGQLDEMARGFEQAPDLPELCRRAAAAVRTITGFGRVMIYQFKGNEAGAVIGEDRDPSMVSFMHHQFPGSDIPRQARQLYVQNRARAIPDAGYEPAPLRPADYAGTDLSAVALRSVSPVHLQYLRNMGVGASASFSIVRDSTLWGLIACHHDTPLVLPREKRVAAAALANALARQIGAKDQREADQRRLRLRTQIETLAGSLDDDRAIVELVRENVGSFRDLFSADGFVFVDGGEVYLQGVGPASADLRDLARWIADKAGSGTFASSKLSAQYPPAAGWTGKASGVLALPLAQPGRMLIWLRVEKVEEVRWAGEPHKLHEAQKDIPLSPRRSFQTWVETVRGQSRPWMVEEIEAARTLGQRIDEVRLHRRIRLLNRELQKTLEERDALVKQQQLMMREVDHRVQNSLNIVSSYFSLQAREAGPGELADHLIEAQARLTAVALLHRRLFRTEQAQSLDIGEYLEELVADLRKALGARWDAHIKTSLAGSLVPTNMAVPIGLVMTELLINAVKYAYQGEPGPIMVSLDLVDGNLRLTVADKGTGRGAEMSPKGTGFGGRMVSATVRRLKGSLEEHDNQPGLRVTLNIPLSI